MEEGDSHERHENIFLALAAIGALALSHAGLAQCWRCVASTNRFQAFAGPTCFFDETFTFRGPDWLAGCAALLCCERLISLALQDRGRWGLLRGPLISERRVLMRINLLLDPDPGRLSIPGEGNPSLSPFPSGLLDFFGRAWLEASCEIPVTPRRHGSIETSKLRNNTLTCLTAVRTTSLCGISGTTLPGIGLEVEMGVLRRDPRSFLVAWRRFP
jgi:hypothetical protein